MKELTVSKVKEYKEMSQDSLAFSCLVSVDGVPAFTAADHGYGGEVEFTPLPGKQKLLAEAEEWAKTAPLGELDPDLDLTPDLGLMVAVLCDQYLEDRFLVRLCKKSIVVRVPGDRKGEYHRFSGTLNDAYRKFIQDKYPGAVILNDRYNR